MKLVTKLAQELRNIRYNVRSRISRIKQSINFDVPYVCQFAQPEHAELSLKKQLKPANDPHWKNTGALSPERYADWAFTMCGMASAAMALKHMKGKAELPALLAEDALKHGVYLDEKGILSSMKYREFASWIKKYGIQADVYSKLSLRGIQYALSHNRLVMISVNPNIRGYDTAPRNQKGGHLVLVVGYDLSKKTIMINNPSGFTSTNTQVKHILTNAEFRKYYAGRGIVLSAIN